jgi:outer membrane immunogenic protein
MKTTCLCLAIFSAACAIASAGSSRYSGKDVVPATVQAPDCAEWTGFYVGGFTGLKFGSIDTQLDPTGMWDFSPLDQAAIQSRAPDELDPSGAELGGLIGYNFQSSCWVFGLEFDAGYVWLRDSESTGTFSLPVLSDKSIQTSFKTHYLMTIAPRIGYAFGRWLPYLTGGLAIGDLDFSQRLHNVSGSPTGPYHTSGSIEETHAGWLLGGGVQYWLNEHWSVRGQYEYIDLGDVAFDAPGSAAFPDFTSHNEASLTEHNASVAAIYKF